MYLYFLQCGQWVYSAKSGFESASSFAREHHMHKMLAINYNIPGLCNFWSCGIISWMARQWHTHTKYRAVRQTTIPLDYYSFLWHGIKYKMHFIQEFDNETVGMCAPCYIQNTTHTSTRTIVYHAHLNMAKRCVIARLINIIQVCGGISNTRTVTRIKWQIGCCQKFGMRCKTSMCCCSFDVLAFMFTVKTSDADGNHLCLLLLLFFKRNRSIY